MKKGIKVITGIFIVILMVMYTTMVSAKTKTDKFLEKLEDYVKLFNGTLYYEDDNIEIDWTTQNFNSSEISYAYNGNIIEYNSGEITTFEEAEEVVSHSMYSLYLIKAALRVNGYTDEQIQTFFADSESEFNYEINGIEFKQIGGSQTFTSEDGLTTTTVSPISVKIDVTKANLNKVGDAPFEPTTATLEDIVEDLHNSADFTSYTYEEKLIYENDVYYDDETISIYHTDYIDEYHNVFFPLEDGIITYEDSELKNYNDAEVALSHHMIAIKMIMIALQVNGYTDEQIQTFFANTENELDYEINGIELKETGVEKEFVSEDGSTKLTMSPMSIKIDLNRANLNKENSKNENNDSNYKTLEGANQKIDNTKELTFRFNIDYSKFLADGKVYIDNMLVDSKNYNSREGSTIITFNQDYVKTLASDTHILKVAVADGEVSTTFTIENSDNKITISNPETKDNITFYVSLLIMSLISFINLGVYIKNNN